MASRLFDFTGPVLVRYVYKRSSLVQGFSKLNGYTGIFLAIVKIKIADSRT